MQRLHNKYTQLSDRDDIIVMANEAHRTQYDTLALNMRTGLPRAAYAAFTGTPLIAGEERTREVFGDYVSIYNFRQSIEDNATVPLYYENRIPEVELINAHLNAQIADVLDRAELGEAAEDAVEREFAREYHVIMRDDRLDKIAEDLVAHFLGARPQRQGDGRLHRQGHRRQDVRSRPEILGDSTRLLAGRSGNVRRDRSRFRRRTARLSA